MDKYAKERVAFGFLWLAVGIVGAAVALAVFYMIGNAVHDSNQQGQQYNLNCIQAGGKMVYDIQARQLVCNR